MKVLVYGGRRARNWNTVFNVLDNVHSHSPITAIIHGAAPGVDSFAGMWAKKRDITELRFFAEWTTYKKAAGPIRNQQMIDVGKPDLCIEFPGGAGTADMHERVIHTGLRLIEIKGE